MAKETVLLYNCGGDEFKTLRALLMMLRVRVRMVEPSRYHLPLEQVAAGKGEEDPKQQADIPEAMMVFCDLGPGRLDQLLNTIWGYEFDGASRTVDVHIRTLRQKLGESGGCIETERGVGYKIAEG